MEGKKNKATSGFKYTNEYDKWLLNKKHKIYLVLPHKGNPLEDTELVSVM